MEKKLNLLYKKIAETVNELIPEEWDGFYFYAQVSETGGGTYFYYQPALNKNKYVYSLEIPMLFHIDTVEFLKNKRSLFPLSEEIKRTFKDNGQDLWYSFTIVLDKSGKLKVHFDYTNWFDTEYSFSDQMIIWKNKYLGETPQDEGYIALVDKYYNEFPDNPI